MRLGSFLRRVFRTSAFIGKTLLYWSFFEIDSLLHPRVGNRALLRRWVPRWSRALQRVFRLDMQVLGLPDNAEGLYPATDSGGVGRIFVMNHRSALDIAVIFAHTDARLVSRHDLAEWPLIGAGARRIGTLFVDRNSRQSGATASRAIATALREGTTIAMFPEGTAFGGDEVHEFRPGAFRAATRTAAQIVPVGIAYSETAAYYTQRSFLDHLREIASLPKMRGAVVFGQPLMVDGRTVVELKEAARQQVQQLVERARAELSAGSV